MFLNDLFLNDYLFLAAITLSSIVVILAAGYIDHRMYTKFTRNPKNREGDD